MLMKYGEALVKSLARRTRCGTWLPLSYTIRLYGGTDKWYRGYVPAYESHLKARRRRRSRVLEIGVGGLAGDYSSTSPGGSLRVWRDYFFRSVIVGFDINEKDVSHLGPRVRFVCGDQTDTEALDRALSTLGGPPDMVIDDGSHVAPHAQQTFEHLFDVMQPGSIYVIEDTHTSYWPGYEGAADAPSGTAVDLARRMVESTQVRDPIFAQRPSLPAPTGRTDVARIDVWPGVFVITKG